MVSFGSLKLPNAKIFPLRINKFIAPCHPRPSQRPSAEQTQLHIRNPASTKWYHPLKGSVFVKSKELDYIDLSIGAEACLGAHRLNI